MCVLGLLRLQQVHQVTHVQLLLLALPDALQLLAAQDQLALVHQRLLLGHLLLLRRLHHRFVLSVSGLDLLLWLVGDVDWIQQFRSDVEGVAGLLGGLHLSQLRLLFCLRLPLAPALLFLQLPSLLFCLFLLLPLLLDSCESLPDCSDDLLLLVLVLQQLNPEHFEEVLDEGGDPAHFLAGLALLELLDDLPVAV